MPQGMHIFQLIRGTSTLDISDLITWGVVQFDGFGMPPVRRITQRGPLQNGDTDVDYRIDARTIRMLVFGKNVSGNVRSLRDQLMGMLKPGNDVINLRWEQSGIVRQIDVHYSGGMNLPSTDWKEYSHNAAFEFRAADPTWYDPVGNSVQFAQVSGASGFVFPLMPSGANMFFNSTLVNVTQPIALTDANAWETFPKIIVTGPITSLVITHQQKNEKIDFGSNAIIAGETYTIDLRYGYKTIVDQNSANQISKLTTDSNLATWSLIAGNNTIQATGTSPSSATSIVIQYNQRYIGV